MHVRPVVLAVRADDGLARADADADADRDGGHSPVTLLERDGDRVFRSEVPLGPGPVRLIVLPEVRSAS